MIDVIKLSGGLKKNANTKYINLSKKVENEMVINIYTNSEIKEKTIISEPCTSVDYEIKNCEEATIITTGEEEVITPVEETTNITEEKDNKVHINSATKEEFMTLSGIGESRAISIIEYRNTNGLFKSIEDLKNISGIGDTLFDKIKENITL